MGWDSSSSWRSKSDVVADQLQNPSILAKKVVKDGVWFLAPHYESGVVCIGFLLIEKQGGSYYAKVLGECEHPYYFDCPKSYLAKAPVVCAGWREQVSAYWAQKEAV